MHVLSRSRILYALLWSAQLHHGVARMRGLLCCVTQKRRGGAMGEESAMVQNGEAESRQERGKLQGRAAT